MQESYTRCGVAMILTSTTTTSKDRLKTKVRLQHSSLSYAMSMRQMGLAELEEQLILTSP